MSQEIEPRRWLLLIYRVPQDPPGRRTYVWRQLKQLGAAYLQQAAAILPELPALRSGLDALAQRIDEYGGEASLLVTTSPSHEWEQAVIGRFNDARNAEYSELTGNVERFEDEIRRETRKGRFAFAQLEDIEGEWEKLQRWHERITSRDFFETPSRADVTKVLADARAALDRFAAQVYQHEGVETETGGPTREAL